jgi:hypothetical protein
LPWNRNRRDGAIAIVEIDSGKVKKTTSNTLMTTEESNSGEAWMMKKKYVIPNTKTKRNKEDNALNDLETLR